MERVIFTKLNRSNMIDRTAIYVLERIVTALLNKYLKEHELESDLFMMGLEDDLVVRSKKSDTTKFSIEARGRGVIYANHSDKNW